MYMFVCSYVTVCVHYYVYACVYMCENVNSINFVRMYYTVCVCVYDNVIVQCHLCTFVKV